MHMWIAGNQIWGQKTPISHPRFDSCSTDVPQVCLTDCIPSRRLRTIALSSASASTFDCFCRGEPNAITGMALRPLLGNYPSTFEQKHCDAQFIAPFSIGVSADRLFAESAGESRFLPSFLNCDFRLRFTRFQTTLSG